MDRRREQRFTEDLPGRICAVDERGCWVTQTCVAHNISRSGALLLGLEQEFRCGDLIRLEYANVKARFRIVWTRDSGGPYRTQAAVQRLEQDKCPWEEILAEQELGQLP